MAFTLMCANLRTVNGCLKNCAFSGDDITRIREAFLKSKKTEPSKCFPNTAFGYWGEIIGSRA